MSEDKILKLLNLSISGPPFIPNFGTLSLVLDKWGKCPHLVALLDEKFVSPLCKGNFQSLSRFCQFFSCLSWCVPIFGKTWSCPEFYLLWVKRRLKGEAGTYHGSKCSILTSFFHMTPQRDPVCNFAFYRNLIFARKTFWEQNKEGNILSQPQHHLRSWKSSLTGLHTFDSQPNPLEHEQKWYFKHLFPVMWLK